MENSNAFTRRTFVTGTSAAVTAGILGLTGCATTVAAPGASGGGNAATKAKTINFYNTAFGEPALNAGWQQVIKGWESTTTSKVKTVTYPYAQAATQMALFGRSGKFSGVGADAIQVLIPMNVLADLSDIVEGLEIPKGALETFTIDQKLYQVPTTASGIGMVINGEIARSVGLKSGLTTDEFATVLEKIKKQDPDLIPYAAVTKNPDLKDAAVWMWAFGSQVVTKDLKCTIGDAESVKAVTWYKELQDQGLTKANIARGDARILFARGQTVMYDDAPIAATFAKKNGASQNIVDNVSAIARPTYGQNETVDRFWGHGLYASKGKGELTSKALIKYVVSNVEAATALYEQTAALPASKKVAEKIPALAKDKFQTAFRTGVAEHAKGGAWDPLAVGPQVDKTIGDGVANILAGQVGVQAGLNDLKKQVQSLLDTAH